MWGSYYVPDTYAPGTSEREAHPGHNNRTAVRDNCGQRKRACTCCLIDRVTAASKTEGVPAVSSIESLMIRRPFGSIDPNSIRETGLHKESAGRPQYGTRYQNFHFDFPTSAFFHSYHLRCPSQSHQRSARVRTRLTTVTCISCRSL